MHRKVLLTALVLFAVVFFGLLAQHAEASVGKASISIYAGTNPVDEFPVAEVIDLGGGDEDISVRLPGKRLFYTLNRPNPLMRGWSAEKDGSGDITVTSPDDLKYVYPADMDYRLWVIRNVYDANLVVFDYNDSDPNLIDTQSDANDPNLYIDYGYDSNGLLTTLSACDGSDCRTYTITYDDANMAIAFSSSCSECGGGAFEYEYDANGLLRKVIDANDSSTVIYEYQYNAGSWLTDVYLGAATDGNHVRAFDYSSDGSGDTIIDIYDYTDVNTYRVRREYRNSAGMVTQRVQYENPDEDPANPIGTSYTEHTYYFYDDNIVTKKVVVPPSVDEPDPNSGIRKEYIYDPNTGRLLTETWFDTNDTNIPVVSNTYSNVLDGNEVFIARIKSSTDTRNATTEYFYDGNSVDPNARLMPEVTTGISDANQQLRYEYEYNYLGRLTLEKQIDANSGGVLVQTKHVYDAYGNLVERWDGYGDVNEITEYKYNGFNEMTRMKLPSGVVSGRSYNDGGRLTSEFVCWDVNDFNEPNDLELTLVSQTDYFYDSRGRLEKTARAVDTNESGFDYNSPSSWVYTEYEYDLRGNRTKVIEDVDGLGLETTYEYNNLGEVIKVTLPTGKWTKTVRDGRGLVAATTVGYGATEVATTEFYYDDNGNLEWEKSPNSIWTKYEYDDFDRVKKITRGL